MRVNIVWSWARQEDLELHRCLYAYLHPRTHTILYIGKADRQTIRERMSGRHKKVKYAAIGGGVSRDPKPSAAVGHAGCTVTQFDSRVHFLQMSRVCSSTKSSRASTIPASSHGFRVRE